MKYFLSALIISISISILAPLSAFAKKTDIVALVNDRPITLYDFTARKKMAVSLNKIDISNPQIERQLNKDILNILIEEEILNQYTEKLGNKISQDEINGAITTIEQRNNMPKGHLLQYMREMGVDVNSFKQQIKGELIKYNIINSLSNSVSVSPSELDVAYINSGTGDFSIESWIFASFDGSDKSFAKMEKLKNQLTTCSKLEEKLYKDFASAEKFVGKSTSLSDKTKSVMLDTKGGKSSSVYQEDGKFKLVLVCTKKSSVSGEDENKAKAFLSNHKMSKKAAKFFKDLRAKSYIKIIN